MWNVTFERYLLFLLIFTRMSGILLFNPVFGKKNVPGAIKVGLALITSVIFTSTYGNLSVGNPETLSFILLLIKEIAIGFTISFVMNLFLSAFLMAGEMVDLQLGVSMSRIYDPQSNSTTPLSGTVFHTMFLLTFFLSNGHLTLMRVAGASFDALPPGSEWFSAQFTQGILALFAGMLVLALKIAIPIIAIELFIETGMGVLMRTVPQINIFVVGLQLKLAVGLLFIVLIVPGLSVIFENTVNAMFQVMMQTVSAMS